MTLTPEAPLGSIDEIMKLVRWGDYQKEDGSWGVGVANKPEIKAAIQTYIETHIIGSDETIERLANNNPTIKGSRSIVRNNLREEQRGHLRATTNPKKESEK